MERPKYRLQRKESYSMPNILGNCSFPVATYRWKDIAVSDDKEILTEYMEYLKTKNPKNEYRIEE